jgi:hypothetical protein
MADRSTYDQFTRYSIVLPLLHKHLHEHTTAGNSRPKVGWTRNLSEKGACVELGEHLDPQTPLWVRLRTPRGALEIEAQVIWAGNTPLSGGLHLHGLVFPRVTPAQRRMLQDVLSQQKRRTGVRLSLDVGVTCERKDRTGLRLEGRTRNISRNGLSVRLPQSVSPGTLLHLTLHTSGGPLTAEGAVVWVELPERQLPGALFRHGVQITGIASSKSLMLGLLLTEPA